MTGPNPRSLLLFVLALVVVAAIYVSVMPDHRSTTQKIGDAVHELPNGADKAVNELGNDRTPGEKIGDAVRHAGDKIKENSSSSN